MKEANLLPFNLAYIAAAEFGELTGRKHYHILLFTNEFIFNDLEAYKITKRNNIMYTSQYLNNMWKKGKINSVQIVENEACFKYILKYTTKLKNVGEKFIKSRFFGKPNLKELNEMNLSELPNSLIKAAKQKIYYWDKKLKANECTQKFFNEYIFRDKYLNKILTKGKQKQKMNKNKFWDAYNLNSVLSNYYHNWKYFNTKSKEF